MTTTPAPELVLYTVPGDDPHGINAVLARRDGWAEIRPGHWAGSGAIVKALKAAGHLVDRRRKTT